MKGRAFSTSIAAMILGILLFPAQSEAQVAVKVTAVNATLIGSPDFGSQLKIRGKKPKFTAKDWLEAEVEMEFAAPKAKDGHIDDVEVSFYVLLKGGGEKKNVICWNTFALE